MFDVQCMMYDVKINKLVIYKPPKPINHLTS